MSLLNSQSSAGNSFAKAADRSMSVGSTTVAPWASSVSMTSVRIGSTTGPVSVGSYVPARQTPIRAPSSA